MNSVGRFESCRKSANMKAKYQSSFASTPPANDFQKSSEEDVSGNVFSQQKPSRRSKQKQQPQQYDASPDNFIQMNQSDSAELECKFCRKLFHHTDHLNEHMKMHSSIQTHECQACQSVFKNSNLLKKHMLRMHSIEKDKNSNTSRCTLCLEIFCNSTRHICKSIQHPKSTTETSTKTNTLGKNFKCPTCSKGFMRASYLAIHARVHTGERGFECKICKKSFTQASHLSGHMKVHTGDKPFSCDFCQKKFALSGNLTKHLRVHTGERPFQCNYCIKSFSQSNSLAVHLRIHTGEKPFQCSQCFKSFSRSSYLSTHMTVHTGDKNYECKHCKKKFSQPGHLIEHIKVHTGERPYQCPQCVKKFAQSGNLIKHMRVHTGEKPYACTQCSRTFSQSSSLTAHLRIHSGEKPYECKYCLKLFSRSGYLLSHLRVHVAQGLLPASVLQTKRKNHQIINNIKEEQPQPEKPNAENEDKLKTKNQPSSKISAETKEKALKSPAKNVSNNSPCSSDAGSESSRSSYESDANQEDDDDDDDGEGIEDRPKQTNNISRNSIYSDDEDDRSVTHSEANSVVSDSYESSSNHSKASSVGSPLPVESSGDEMEDVESAGSESSSECSLNCSDQYQYNAYPSKSRSHLKRTAPPPPAPERRVPAEPQGKRRGRPPRANNNTRTSVPLEPSPKQRNSKENNEQLMMLPTPLNAPLKNNRRRGRGRKK